MIAKFFAPLWAKILAGALLAALLALGVQTYRVGYWKHTATVLRLDLDKIKLAQDLAGQMAKGAKAETERQFREAAERAEHDHAIELEKARDATAAFIARNRVRAKAVGRSPSGTAQAGQGGSAAVPDGAPETAGMVVVPATDVTNGTDNYLYARKAYDLFQDLIAKGLAEPGTP